MLTVLLGGARSGKSALAEDLGRRSGTRVTYLATCPRIAGDDDLDRRIERHRADRPTDWITVEEEIDLTGAIESAGDGFLIVDCLTLWVANMQFQGSSPAEVEHASQRAIDAARRRCDDTVVVSNEVGLGIVPADATTRDFRDTLGRVHQQWVRAADRALLLVAGRAVPLHDPHELLE